jgi:hypothetical protein
MDEWLINVLLGAGFVLVSLSWIYFEYSWQAVAFGLLAAAHVLKGLWIRKT